MKGAFALGALGLLGACAGTVVPPADIEGPVELGEVAYVSGPRVRPDRLIEDSRCPIGTQCVWAGRVVLRATVFGGGWSRQIDFALGTPVPVADGMLTLVSAEPEPTASDQSSSPRFTFAFQGGL